MHDRDIHAVDENCAETKFRQTKDGENIRKKSRDAYVFHGKRMDEHGTRDKFGKVAQNLSYQYDNTIFYK